MGDNILYLNLTSSEGNTFITSNIPVHSTLSLTKVCITWDSQSDSATNGPLVNLEINTIFDHNRINSNRTKNVTAIPLFNDVSSQVSIYTLDMPISSVNSITQQFEYKLTDSVGNLITNFNSIQIVMNYKK
jgi:hypothetical protein